MTLEQFERDYAAWLDKAIGGCHGKGMLAEFLRGRLPTASVAERIQLRAWCAARGQAATYDQVRAEVAPDG